MSPYEPNALSWRVDPRMPSEDLADAAPEEYRRSSRRLRSESTSASSGPSCSSDPSRSSDPNDEDVSAGSGARSRDLPPSSSSSSSSSSSRPRRPAGRSDPSRVVHLPPRESSRPSPLLRVVAAKVEPPRIRTTAAVLAARVIAADAVGRTRPTKRAGVRSSDRRSLRRGRLARNLSHHVPRPRRRVVRALYRVPRRRRLAPPPPVLAPRLARLPHRAAAHPSRRKKGSTGSSIALAHVALAPPLLPRARARASDGPFTADATSLDPGADAPAHVRRSSSAASWDR